MKRKERRQFYQEFIRDRINSLLRENKLDIGDDRNSRERDGARRLDQIVRVSLRPSKAIQEKPREARLNQSAWRGALSQKS